MRRTAFSFLLKTLCAVALLLLCAPCAQPAPASITLNEQRLHLRSSNAAEWEEYATSAPFGRQWETLFTSISNATPAALFIRQDDVRQDWSVDLNGKRLGKLFLMEADLVHALTVPTGAIRNGTNVLAIVPPKENDDIF